MKLSDGKEDIINAQNMLLTFQNVVWVLFICLDDSQHTIAIIEGEENFIQARIPLSLLTHPMTV